MAAGDHSSRHGYFPDPGERLSKTEYEQRGYKFMIRVPSMAIATPDELEMVGTILEAFDAKGLDYVICDSDDPQSTECHLGVSLHTQD